MKIKKIPIIKKLTNEQFYVTQKHGTEKPFSGEYLNNKEEGLYECVCCQKQLFSSNAKYDSGTGWPSFFEPLSKDAIGMNVDNSHGMIRNEVHCLNCSAHLGHVFPDGPKPSGLRYCINSLSLSFKKRA